jgi:MFS family permease
VRPSALFSRLAPSPQDAGFGPRFVAAVSLGSTLNPVNSSIIAIALVSIGQTFHVGIGTTAWLVSSLYLATAVGQPAMGKLADRLGAWRVYVAGLALVAVGGGLGFWGPSIEVLVVARVIIGLGTSAAYPAAMSMVRRQSERLRTQTPGGVLGALAIAGLVSAAVGPPLGALLIAIGGWRSIFLVNLPLALVGAVGAVVWLPRDRAAAREGAQLWRALDPPGLVLFAGWLTMLLIFLMGLPRPTWYLLAASVVLLITLVARELRVTTPFIDVRMLARKRALSVTYLRFAVTMFVTYCFVYGWTEWLQQSRGFSASASGLLLMPSFVVAAVVSALTARRRRVWGPLVAGTIALTAGSSCLLLLGRDASVVALIAVSCIFGVQSGLNVVANQAALYAQAPSDQIGTAAGLLRTSMYLGAIASASLLSITYEAKATDAGLHTLGVILTISSAALVIAIVLDRELRVAASISADSPTAAQAVSGVSPAELEGVGADPG